MSEPTIGGESEGSAQQVGLRPPPGPDPRTVDPPFFENEQQRLAVLRGIHSGILPVKFAYGGSGARAHDEFVRSTGVVAQQRYGHPTRHEARVVAGLARAGVPCGQLVDIGPGNGVRLAAVLHGLRAAGYGCRRLLAIDFSRTLLALAQARLADLDDPPLISADLWDIETSRSDGISRWRRSGPVVATFFGNTVGNVECPRTTLANIHASLRPGDVFLLGVLLRGPHRSPAEILSPYCRPSFRSAVLEPLRAAGIPLDHVDFAVRWEEPCVYGVATFTRTVRTNSVEIRAGHRLRCFQSSRLTASHVLKLTTAAGFDVTDYDIDNVEDHMIVTTRRGERRKTP